MTPRVDEPPEQAGSQAKRDDEAAFSRISEASDKLPQSFEETRKQVNRQIKYVSRGAGYALFLTETEVVLALRNEKQSRDLSNPKSEVRIPHSVVLRMKPGGVNRSPIIKGEHETGVRSNDSGGNDAAKRQTSTARFEKVRYAQVYPGVDMVYYGDQQQLKYDFEVAPGGDARRIALEFERVQRMQVESGSGDLVIEVGGVEVRQRKPVAYQKVGAERQEIAAHFVVRGTKRVMIEFGRYDRTKPLVITPALSYSTRLSGDGQDADTSGAQMLDQQGKDQPIIKPNDDGVHHISGSVVDANTQVGVKGVLMMLDGPEFNITYTDDQGNFSFDNLKSGGDYTVSPDSAHYTFKSDPADFHDLQSDKFARFTASPNDDGYTYSISGWVGTKDGFYGLQYVPVFLDGTEYGYTSTDYDGYYSFEDLEAGGYYTVSLFDANYLFDPEYHEFYDLQSNEDASFGIRDALVIGRVSTIGGVGVGGVEVTLTGGVEDMTRTVTTDSDGYYLFEDVPNEPPYYGYFYYITPASPNYRFDPLQQVTYYLTYDPHDFGYDFTAIPRTYAIIGVVRLGAARLPGVTMTLTSPLPAGFPPQTLTTNSGGAYVFNGLPPERNYKVTAMMNGYQIGPAFRAVYYLDANQTRVDFDVRINSITGRITRPGTTIGIEGVTVKLTSPSPANFADRTVRTDSTGKYTFKVLPTGRNYTIKAVKSGVTFTPATRTILNLSTNIPPGATTNFTGTGP